MTQNTLALERGVRVGVKQVPCLSRSRTTHKYLPSPWTDVTRAISVHRTSEFYNQEILRTAGERPNKTIWQLIHSTDIHLIVLPYSNPTLRNVGRRQRPTRTPAVRMKSRGERSSIPSLQDDDRKGRMWCRFGGNDACSSMSGIWGCCDSEYQVFTLSPITTCTRASVFSALF